LFVGAKKNVSTIYAGWQDPEQTNKVSSKRNGFSQRNLRQCFSLDFVGVDVWCFSPIYKKIVTIYCFNLNITQVD